MSRQLRSLSRLETRRAGSRQLIFLLKDNFLVAESAPLTSPRTAEPGPGTLTLVQTDGQFSTSGGKLVIPAQTTPAWGDLGGYSESHTREAGLVLYGVLNLTTWEECGIGWHTAAAVVDPDNAEHAIQANATDGTLERTMQKWMEDHAELIAVVQEDDHE